MIQELILQWEENKNKLEEYFRTTEQKEYGEYIDILKKTFEICEFHHKSVSFDLDKITVIDDGDYQGTQIYIIPKDVYQPNEEDYLVTTNYYGSCSGCDTLQSIHEYEEGLPNEEQIKDYMTVALHLVQRLKWLYEKENS